MKRILRAALMGAGFALSVLFMLSTTDALGFDFKDAAAIYNKALMFLFAQIFSPTHCWQVMPIQKMTCTIQTSSGQKPASARKGYCRWSWQKHS